MGHAGSHGVSLEIWIMELVIQVEALTFERFQTHNVHAGLIWFVRTKAFSLGKLCKISKQKTLAQNIFTRWPHKVSPEVAIFNRPSSAKIEEH